MGEELQTLNTTPETGSGDMGQAQPEPITQATEVPAQAVPQPQPVSDGQVEPSQQNNSSNESRIKPSEFVRMRRELKEYRTKMKEYETMLQQMNKPADSKPALKDYTDNEILEMGLGKFAKQLREEAARLAYEQMRNELPNHLTEYQRQFQENQVKQELRTRYDKLQDEGKYEAFMDALEKHPELDYYANKDPLTAFDRVMEVVNKETKSNGFQTPLAGKKSRLGIAGSSTPTNSGSGKATLEQLRAEKAKLQEQFSKSFRDPAFMKKWEDNTAAIAKLAAQE